LYLKDNHQLLALIGYTWCHFRSFTEVELMFSIY
jgi:hypothetical protein